MNRIFFLFQREEGDVRSTQRSVLFCFCLFVGSCLFGVFGVFLFEIVHGLLIILLISQKGNYSHRTIDLGHGMVMGGSQFFFFYQGLYEPCLLWSGVSNPQPCL